MYAKFMILALVGLSHLTHAGAITNRAAIARPASTASSASSSSAVSSSSVASSSSPASSPASANTAAFSGANPFSSMATASFTNPFPLTSGFSGFPFPSTTPSASQFSAIEDEAQGVLPDVPADSNQVHYDPTVSLAVLAFLELFEVAFFSDLLQKLVEKKPGFQKVDIESSMSSDHMTNTIAKIVAQEELHYLSALDGLPPNVQSQIQSCSYLLNSTNLTQAIRTASLVTDVVLSTLPDIQTGFAQNNSSLIALVGSIIGSEGEQNGFFREYLNQTGPQLPFLPGGAMAFGFNAVLQQYVHHESCDVSVFSNNTGGIPKFSTLWAVNPADDEIMTNFSSIEDGSSTDNGNSKVHFRFNGMPVDSPYITYMKQQNSPVTVPCTNPGLSELDIANECTAQMPSKFTGLTMAVVTYAKGPYSGPAHVAQDTLAGPLIIEI